MTYARCPIPGLAELFENPLQKICFPKESEKKVYLYCQRFHQNNILAKTQKQGKKKRKKKTVKVDICGTQKVMKGSSSISFKKNENTAETEYLVDEDPSLILPDRKSNTHKWPEKLSVQESKCGIRKSADNISASTSTNFDLVGSLLGDHKQSITSASETINPLGYNLCDNVENYNINVNNHQDDITQEMFLNQDSCSKETSENKYNDCNSNVSLDSDTFPLDASVKKNICDTSLKTETSKETIINETDESKKQINIVNVSPLLLKPSICKNRNKKKNIHGTSKGLLHSMKTLKSRTSKDVRKIYCSRKRKIQETFEETSPGISSEPIVPNKKDSLEIPEESTLSNMTITTENINKEKDLQGGQIQEEIPKDLSGANISSTLNSTSILKNKTFLLKSKLGEPKQNDSHSQEKSSNPVDECDKQNFYSPNFKHHNLTENKSNNVPYRFHDHSYQTKMNLPGAHRNHSDERNFDPPAESRMNQHLDKRNRNLSNERIMRIADERNDNISGERKMTKDERHWNMPDKRNCNQSDGMNMNLPGERNRNISDGGNRNLSDERDMNFPDERDRNNYNNNRNLPRNKNMYEERNSNLLDEQHMRRNTRSMSKRYQQQSYSEVRHFFYI